MRCLCCNREIFAPKDVEKMSCWHGSCIKRFFGTSDFPELSLDNNILEKLANDTVNKGMTVPGVQKKLSLHLSKEKAMSRLTLVDYPSGYILKPQSPEYRSLPEAEFLVMKMAELAGISTVPNGLIKVDDEYAYITRRIDRAKDKKYAMEDFCQLSERVTADKYKGSYENCGKILKKYTHNVGLDCTEFFYRLVFCFITGNSDMHLKNFSLMEDKPMSRIFSLSQAYDLLPVNIILKSDLDDTALTLNGKKRNIRKKDFYALAMALGIGDNVAKKLIDRLINMEDKFVFEIEESYLDDQYKEDFKSLMGKRVGRLN